MLEQFALDIDSVSIHGELRKGSPMVVFSHGFGVKRDSRGMFTDIAAALPEGFGYILFDYNHIDGENVTLAPYSQQSAMLKAVVQKALTISDSVHIVAHSMGSITTSLADVDVQKTILLAPPAHFKRPLGKISWEERPGAHWDGETLIVPRKDGTTSVIPRQFFIQAHDIDCVASVSAYADAHPTTIIRALEEEILSDMENYALFKGKYLSQLNLPGNHNFDPPAREELVKTIVAILNS